MPANSTMDDNVTILNVTIYHNHSVHGNVSNPLIEDYDLLRSQLNATDDYYNNRTNSWTGSEVDDYLYTWNDSVYPSGLSHLNIIMISFFVTVIMILIVVGNMLVCIAIATEKSLKTVQNWFIASLAVSDFLVGLIVMPFSLAREVMGYWIFGNIWCEVHSALDVFLCTASINSLCLISLDRYWSVTHAIEYLKKRTPRRSVAMICFVWVISAVISLPPLVGWKKPDKPTDYPMCLLSDDLGYVLYSAFGSFYVPAFVMVFVYCRIFVAARSRARKHLKKKHTIIASTAEFTNDPVKDKSTTTTTCTSFSNPSPTDRTKDFVAYPPIAEVSKNSESNGTNNPLSVKTSSAPEIVIEGSSEIRDDGTTQPTTPVDPPLDPDVCDDYDDDDDDDEFDEEKPTYNTEAQLVNKLSVDDECRLRPDMNYIPSTSPSTGSDVDQPCLPEEPAKERKASMLRAPKFEKSPYGSTMSLAEMARSEEDVSDLPDDNAKGASRKKKKVKVKYQIEELPKRRLPTEAEKHKRRIAKARERRATLILGLIMASFILAWLPFFVLYVLEALCRENCRIGPTAFAIAFWLGYCNSALNPIIYTIFNRDFRKAFRKILFK